MTKSRDINTEYKFVIKRAGGQIQWEDGPNRLLPLKLWLGGIAQWRRAARAFDEDGPTWGLVLRFRDLLQKEERERERKSRLA